MFILKEFAVRFNCTGTANHPETPKTDATALYEHQTAISVTDFIYTEHLKPPRHHIQTNIL